MLNAIKEQQKEIEQLKGQIQKVADDLASPSKVDSGAQPYSLKRKGAGAIRSCAFLLFGFRVRQAELN